MQRASSIASVLIGLALLASPAVVPAFAQENTSAPTQEETAPDPDLIEAKDAQRELSASEAEIQQLVNEDFIEAAPLGKEEISGEAAQLKKAPSTQRLRALAQAKNQLGYKETPYGTNCNKFSRYFGKGCQAWCADFVSWAFDWQGNRDKKLRWRNPSAVASILAWAKRNNHLVKSPRPGDIFIIKTKTASHTGFVRTVNAKAGTFTTVEGNSSNKVRSGRRTISRYQFVRFP